MWIARAYGREFVAQTEGELWADIVDYELENDVSELVILDDLEAEWKD